MGIPGAVGFFLFINIFLLQLSILFYINGSIAEREREREIKILTLLDFINRTRTGLFVMVWLLIMWKIN